MEKEAMILFSLVVVVALFGLVFVEAGALDSDFSDVTGQKSKWKKKFKKAFKPIQQEAKRFAGRVEAEAQRVEKKASAEAGRFGARAEDEWKRFDNRVSAELERSADKTEDEFKRYNARIEAEINRVDDNLKKLGKEIEEKVKKELERLLKKVKNEVEAQKGVFKNMAKGNVCGAYKSAQKSDAYNVNQLIYNQLVPPIKSGIRPVVQGIVQPAIPLVQSALASLNAIPIAGNALYAALAPSMLAYMQGPMIDDLSENAAKKAIREALEECN